MRARVSSNLSNPLPLLLNASPTTVDADRLPLAGWGPTEQALGRALLGLRWAGLALACVVVAYDWDARQRGATAVWALTVMTVITVALTVAARHRHGLLGQPMVVVGEVVVAAGVLLADGWAFGSAHSPITAFAVMWALAAVMTVGVAYGPAWGAAAGAVAAAAAWLGHLAPDLRPVLVRLTQPEPGSQFVPTVVAVALFAVAGIGVGRLSRLLRASESEVADLRARQQMASTLHDGALQAFAYIARRSADPDIARVARDADIELRGYLTATLTPGTDDLRTALIRAAQRVEPTLDAQLHLAVDDELPSRPPEVIAAAAGAVTEALANAAKHAAARRVTVYAAGADGGVSITVIDDGVGFDLDRIPAGGGLDQSIRARLRQVGGTATINSTPGSGTEVELWIP